MTNQPVGSRTADADVFLPADGVTLLGEQQEGRYPGRRFQVGLGDGQVIQLPLLLYLIMAAIAEGAVDGGWSADEVGSRVGTASGQRLTADNVRYLVAGKLAPLGLIAAGVADLAGEAPEARQWARASLLPALTIRGLRLRHAVVSAIDRMLAWTVIRRVERLLPTVRRRRLALALGGIAMLVSVAAAAPIMAGTGDRHPAAHRETGATRLASVVDASWLKAAAWVAQQVSPDVTVWCDPGMCRRLQNDGFPGVRLRPLPSRRRVLSGPGVVIVTSAVRSQIDSGMAAPYAPRRIASFGSGAALVQVRMLAPGGPAAYRARLAAERTALVSGGRQLLANSNIRFSPSARTALRAGQVDARMLTLLALLSAQLPVRLVGFIGAPGADPGVPLRGAEIALASTADRAVVVALLDAQRGPYRPTMTADGGNDGRSLVVDLRFDASVFADVSPQ